MIAVVVVAYSRPYETRRLVDSVSKAYFDSDQVDLIVSIDKSICQQEVHDACQDVVWPHGQYSIIMRPERMGLRPHILKCGELTEQYDGVIVLEDDLEVSPNFYRYAKAALAYYDTDERVAQISLYAYGVNEFVSRPFYPEKTAFDTYAMQVTQSWGECWSTRMWNDFKASAYYTVPTLVKRNDIPDRVNHWKENSWKKNFTHYLADSGKYVIYPYVSYTTNYTIAGEHCRADVPDYHVMMQQGSKTDFAFCSLSDCVKYDLFFERQGLDIPLEEYKNKQICVDLYASKRDFDGADILASTNRLPYKVLAELALSRKPHEINLLHPEMGRGIYLYDLHTPVKKLPKSNQTEVIRYDVGCLSWRRTLKHGRRGAVGALRKRLKGLLK